ncbi:uncharacterized protein LOC127796848 [Diospyros lotus]|uniref:uncharacterized protein LOC127796848 n=1 Tax=Diospyros lotus TaxID=55363 RepID=UPI00225A7BBE|nr:uncharacterized protein LOC127796848 [Diospyros lotus]
MCIDFIDLKKACSNDSYSLPNIDWLVDGASDYKYLSFMDTYFRYDQIRMHPDDEEKTKFIMENANFCYRIGQNIEVYVDDMMAKTSKNDDYYLDLVEIFANSDNAT